MILLMITSHISFPLKQVPQGRIVAVKSPGLSLSCRGILNAIFSCDSQYSNASLTEDAKASIQNGSVQFAQ